MFSPAHKSPKEKPIWLACPLVPEEVTTTGSLLRGMDKWARRKVRCGYWKCWKRVGTRLRALVRLGVSRGRAWQWANSRKAYWRVAGSGILDRALGNAKLTELGWTLFYPRYLQAKC